ncbi:MAG: 5'-phosphoribosylglycinamide transformylase [Cyanobium sp.]|jgi:hypothetical protein
MAALGMAGFGLAWPGLACSGLAQLGLDGPLALSTAGDAAAGLPFGLDIVTLQNGVLIYLGLSSLAFVLVWLVGYLRSR